MRLTDFRAHWILLRALDPAAYEIVYIRPNATGIAMIPTALFGCAPVLWAEGLPPRCRRINFLILSEAFAPDKPPAIRIVTEDLASRRLRNEIEPQTIVKESFERELLPLCQGGAYVD